MTAIRLEQFSDTYKRCASCKKVYFRYQFEKGSDICDACTPLPTLAPKPTNLLDELLRKPWTKKT